MLDSGSTLSYLPLATVRQIASSFGASLQSDGSIPIDCSAKKQGGSVDFTFADLTIHVPMSEFIWEVDGSCLVGVLPTSSGTTPLLGDTFLRSAYGTSLCGPTQGHLVFPVGVSSRAHRTLRVGR